MIFSVADDGRCWGPIIEAFDRRMVNEAYARRMANSRPAGLCTARPWRSCSRPDGTPLRCWDRGYVWHDTGVNCEDA